MADPHDFMQSPGALIRRAQQVHAALWAELVGTEFTSAQFALLTALQRYPDADQVHLSRESSIDTSTVHAIILRLESRGLVSRRRSTDDRRRWLVNLTEAGRQTVSQLKPHVLQIPDQLLRGLTESDRHELSRLLGIIVAQGETAVTSGGSDNTGVVDAREG